MSFPQADNVASGNGDEGDTHEDTITSTAKSAHDAIKDEIDFTANEVFVKVEPEDDYEIEDTDDESHAVKKEQLDSLHIAMEQQVTDDDEDDPLLITKVEVLINDYDPWSSDNLQYLTRWQSEQNSGCRSSHSTEITQKQDPKLNVNICTDNRETLLVADVKSKYDKPTACSSCKLAETCSSSGMNTSIEDRKTLVLQVERLCSCDWRRPKLQTTEQSWKKDEQNTSNRKLIKNNKSKKPKDGAINENVDKIDDRHNDINIGSMEKNNNAYTKEGEDIEDEIAVVYKCHHCDKEFKEKCSLSIHMSVHRLDISIDLKTHDGIHTEDNSFKCRFCRKCFFWKNDMKTTFLTKEQLLKCSFCEKSFSRQSFLRIHERIHTKEKPFQCSFCFKSFTQKGHLRRHERIHTKEKPFKCSFCGKGFAQSSQQKVHERIHTKENQFICNVCGKGFNRRGSLRDHERFHTKEKPFKCRFCDKCFSLKSNLRAHERIHTKDKPFKCRICNEGFSQKSNQVRHERIHTKD